ncbi:hypothetical protein SAMN06309944_0370 [Micrococcales bacterium KH10]|nr:hypothetical protein SAMN06309944_0370 [Micrococcales bacterium KH10]
MNNSILRKIIVGITAVGIGFFAAGCSSNGDDSPTTPSNETNSESSATNPFDTDSSADNSDVDDSDVADADSEPSRNNGESSDVLDSYIATVQEQSKDMLDSMGGIYSDIEIRAVHPSTMEYVYTYAQQVPTAESRDGLMQQSDSLQGICDSAVYSEMERFGISDPSVKFTYLNADSSDIWSYTCQ